MGGGLSGCRGRSPEVVGRSRGGGIPARYGQPAIESENRRRGVVMKFFVLPIMALLAVPAVDAATVKQPLHATVVAPGAQGKTSFALGGNASRGRRGKLKVVVRHLSPGKSFGISVAGVRIGTLTTNGAGSGSASFSNPQKGHSQFLGVDPQGHLVEVSDDQGEDVLEGDMPEDNNQDDIQCC